MKRIILIALSFAVATSVNAGRVRLKADHVVLRLQPSFRAEPVTQVSIGDILQSTGSDGDWVQVLPPPDVYYYVHSQYVDKGTITGNRVRMRTGAGVGYEIVGELQKGDSVDVKGVWNEWLKVTPPQNCSLWVHKTLVEEIPEPGVSPVAIKDDSPAGAQPVPVAPTEPSAPPAVSPEQPAQPSVTPVPPAPPADSAVSPEPPRQETAPAGPDTVVATAPVMIGGSPEKLEPPRALEECGLVPLNGQGRLGVYEGVLGKRGMFSSEVTRYRLVASDGNQRRTVCYVMGNDAQLTGLTGSTIAVAGREYWIRGEKEPILVADEIVVRQRPEGRSR